ncbi:MAG: winged helix-turn-helix domain-containing protein, partial [Armatimonadetes bacterium]|nr:winged helix-turn-helix domain-containing protein [Armatimonadota bacterium]
FTGFARLTGATAAFLATGFGSGAAEVSESHSSMIAINQEGSAIGETLQAKRFDEAKEILRRAEALTILKDKVMAIMEEWDSLTSAAPEPKPVAKKAAVAPVKRAKPVKAVRVTRAKKSSYYLPILRVLSEMGGEGRAKDVLLKVHETMQDILSSADDERMASGSKLPYWQYTAQFARNDLLKKGYLKANSARGLWELSGEGREYLKQNSTE